MSKTDYSAIGQGKAKRDANGRFLKGASGNPSGVHIGYGDFKKLCRDYSEEALLKVVKIMRGECEIKLVQDDNGEIDVVALRSFAPDARTQLNAAQYIIDRGHGKPTQSVEQKKATRTRKFSAEEQADAVRMMKRKIRQFEDENGEVQEH